LGSLDLLFKAHKAAKTSLISLLSAVRSSLKQALIDLTAETPKMKKNSRNIKLLFDNFLEKGTFCSEILI
jgi:hypothetical protein